MISIDDAYALAIEAHKGQVDLDGNPVIWHPTVVALNCRKGDEMIAALLHDVLEDTDKTMDDLREAGVPDNVCYALELLTHKKGESYSSYIDKIVESGNDIALAVKVQDLLHNIRRNDKSTPEKRRIYEKHIRGLEQLSGYIPGT